MTAGMLDIALGVVILAPLALTLAYVVRDMITKGNQ